MLMAFGNMFKKAFRLNPEAGSRFLLMLTEEIEEMLKGENPENTDNPSGGERQRPR